MKLTIECCYEVKYIWRKEMSNKFIRFINKNNRVLIIIFIILSMPLIYSLVYFTGGIKFVYSHTMYIPIIIGGFFLGRYAGAAIGLVGGILLGPLMPLVVETGEPQTFVNWGYRLIMFILIGFIGGYFSDFLRKKMNIIRDMSSINPETMIPNVNSLVKPNLTNQDKYSVFTVIVSDKTKISNIFGYDMFHKVMFLTYNKLKNTLQNNVKIVQSDSNKFWIMYPNVAIQDGADEIMSILKDQIKIDDINLFVEYYTGAGNLHSIEECLSLKPFQNSDCCAIYAQEHNLPFVICDKENLQKRLNTDLLTHFHDALKRNETYLTYHPIVNLENMEITGVEALIRWLHPSQGIIQPGEFIPLVESTQLIHPLTEWVLRRGMKKIKEFNDNGCPIIFSFNISAKNFKDPMLFDKVSEIVNQMEIEPKNIRLEITETVLMDQPDQSRNTIEKLRGIGVSLAIDDFGRGYSSLAYLAQFDIKTIKIDRYFISRLNDKSVFEIVKATINLAHQLGYMVVAEGVESIQVLQVVKELKCDYAQGFYFCKPIHEKDILSYYISHNKYNLKENSFESSSN